MVLVEIYTKKRLSRSLCVRVVFVFVLRFCVLYERKRRVGCWVNGEIETSVPIVFFYDKECYCLLLPPSSTSAVLI